MSVWRKLRNQAVLDFNGDPITFRRKIGLKVSPMKWARVNGVCLNIYLCGFAKNELTEG